MVEKHDGRHNLNRLRNPVDKDEWPEEPTIPGAYYNPLRNAITTSAAILQNPLYNKTHLIAINYGSLGSIIGHEINHGFDDDGSQYDKNGNKRNWWTQFTLNNYNVTKQCFIDQYNKYEVPGLDDVIYVQGEFALGENIGDSAGIKTAYKAYKNRKMKLGQAEIRLPGLEDYSEDQIFFISAGQVMCENIKPKIVRSQLSDPHPRSETRVRGFLSNMEQFSTAFACPEGAKMNPIKKCNLWY